MADQPTRLAPPAFGDAVASIPATRSVAPALRRALDLAVAAAIGAWLGFYLITLFPSIALDVFRATVLFHAVTAAVLIPYLVSLVVRRTLPGGSPLDLPVIGAVAAYFLATAASENWRVSLESSLVLLAAASAFFVLSDRGLFRRWQVELGLMAAVAAASVRAIWASGESYLDGLRLREAAGGGLSLGDYIPPAVPRVEAVGDHANMLGMALAIGLPFFVAGALRGGSHAALRIASGAGAAGVLLALFLTLSRGAWLGAFAGTVVVLAGALILLPGGRAAARRLGDEFTGRRWLLAFSGGALVLVIIAGVLFVASSWETRPEWLFRESASPRWDAVTTGAEVYRDHPLLGAGPDTFGLLYPEYSGKHPRFHFHVHNGFLQTAVDAGVPGILAMAALGGGLAWVLARSRPKDPRVAVSLIAAAGALVAFGVHAQLDAPNQSKTVLFTLAAVGAVASLAYHESEHAGRTLRPGLRRAGRAAGILVPAAMVGLLIMWARLDAAHYFYSNGVHNANAGLWDQAIDDIEHAVDLDPNAAIYHLELGVVHGAAYFEDGDLDHLGQALGHLDRALALEPRSGIGHANAALLLVEAQLPDEARRQAALALRYANGDPAVVLAAGVALEQAGTERDAIEAYSRAIFLDVDLANSPFWETSEFRRERFPEVIGNSALVFNPCVLLRLSISGAPPGPLSREEALEGCAALVGDGSGALAGRTTLAEALIWEGRFEDARPLLDDVLARQPDFGPARTALGRWYAAQGELARAREQWALAGELDEVEALVLLGDSYAPEPVPGAVVGQLRARLHEGASEVQFHLNGILYYRRSFYRESPFMILLPGAWQDAVPRGYAAAQNALERWTESDP